ncbi:MAG: hypothetical protein AABZ12_13710 [Planctomycetota bacterium]
MLPTGSVTRPLQRGGGVDRPARLAFIVLLALTLFQAFSRDGRVLPEAVAQIPDAGLQRKLILDEIRRSNELLSDIRGLLAGGKLQVPPGSTDNSPGSAAPTVGGQR